MFGSSPGRSPSQPDLRGDYERERLTLLQENAVLRLDSEATQRELRDLRALLRQQAEDDERLRADLQTERTQLAQAKQQCDIARNDLVAARAALQGTLQHKLRCVCLCMCVRV
jgi:hypothetical protein